jgi:hypothetical protein
MKNDTKTAVQQLIDRLKWNIKQMPNEKNYYTQGYKAGLNFVIECATTILEKEKEQIEIAFDLGRDEVTSAFIIDGEDYFNKKFKK